MGAIYHVRNRGDRREPIFRDDADRQRCNLMKELLTFVFSISLLSLSQALGAVLSATNSGIYIAVAGASSAKETIRFDDRLVWRPFCNIGVVQLNYADPDYSIRVNMIGPDGKLVTKTEKGKTFGANFEKGRRYENAVRGWHMGSIDAQGGYDSREGALSGPLLPAGVVSHLLHHCQPHRSHRPGP